MFDALEKHLTRRKLLKTAGKGLVAGSITTGALVSSARYLMENKQRMTPGEEGLRDIRLIQTIYEAAQTGQKIQL